ncbi:DUF6263 family protein [Candidatus Palauibacter sp.]|uniref:DUF6263 family protein n=1 Tax=Candidatus Palauibacter sp. TaxID=3101350 RepID=UPI003B028041
MNQTRMKASILSAAGAALAVGCAAPLHGQTLLRMTPAEGQVSRYVVEAETSMAGTVMSTQSLYRTETIASVRGDAIEVQAVVDSSAVTEAMPGAGGPDLSGMSYAFSMDPRARVTGLTDAGTLSAATEPAVRAMLGTSFFELPEGEVSPGDSWSGQVTTEIPAGMGGTMTMETDVTYTFAGLDGDRAKISLEGTVTMSGSAAGMTMDGTGSVSGTAIFDTGRSRLDSHDSVLDVNINAGGMAMSMQTTTTRNIIS